MKTGTNAALLVLSVYLVIELVWLLPAPTEWTWDLVGLRLSQRASVFACLIVLRAAQPEYLEYVLCGVEIFFLRQRDKLPQGHFLRSQYLLKAS